MTGRVLTERLAEAILADLNVAVAHVGADLLVLAHTPGLAAFSPVAADNLVGQSVTDLFPELVGSEGDLAAVAHGRLPRFELPMINRVGPTGSERRYITLTAVPSPTVRDGLVMLVQDVTAQGDLQQQVVQRLNEVRLLRAELEVANARLTRLDAEKSEFLRMAAHDLRAPLTVIRGYVEMAIAELKPRVDEDAVEFLGVVLARTQQMAHLIDNLLDIEKIESGEVKLHLEPIDLTALVQQVAQGFLPLMRQKELRLECKLLANLPHPVADWDRLIQALNNLVSNAIQFTPASGQVTLETLLQNREVVVQVSDTGLGIAPGDQARLFQRFFRADDARQRHISGTGLGLSIVRAIIEQHGGRVFCRSQLGQGSTFGFALPLEGA